MSPDLLPIDLDHLTRRVETERAGPFVFQLGVTATDLELALHRVGKDVPHPDNRPGLIRDNPKSHMTYEGDKVHGGRYKHP